MYGTAVKYPMRLKMDGAHWIFVLFTRMARVFAVKLR